MLEVVSATPLSPLMRRLVLRLDCDVPLPVEEPAEIITLIWPASGAAGVVLPERGRWRFPEGTPGQHWANYTVRLYDRDAGLVTIDFFGHGDEDHGAVAESDGSQSTVAEADGSQSTMAEADEGRGSSWARTAAPGDRVGFAGTRVHWVTDPTASWTLLVGDETALPSIAAIAETLPAGRRHIAVAEVRDAAERAALDAAHPEVHWVDRGDRAPGESRALTDVVRGLDLPPGRGQVWAGGESLMIQRLRRHLTRDRGLSRDQVCAMGYWSHPRPRLTTA
ncbi:siderophore-interacting protein [Sphaerisporangium sp. NPDC051011]|uniref:siderophore-interacting protein n=1 Tax=Sphaerisporangium sp. NPDC051011 TaxID=3155792 RepID=UPI0033E1A4CC